MKVTLTDDDVFDLFEAQRVCEEQGREDGDRVIEHLEQQYPDKMLELRETWEEHREREWRRAFVNRWPLL